MFVQKLSIQHHHKVLELFSDECIYYHFLINDLIDNNYQGETFQAFGEFDEKGSLFSILVNNYGNLTYFAKTDRCFEVYLDALQHCKFSKISGSSWLVEKVLPYVNAISDTRSYLGIVQEVKAHRRYPNIPLQTITNAEEIGMQYDLLTSTNEYKLDISRETYIQQEMSRLRLSKDRTMFISMDNKMVASCSTLRESTNSAIIIGVVTHPDYRGQGYGTEVLIGLFEQLLQEGKYPYLFYNNPAARSVYLNIGMFEVCEWRVVIVKEGEIILSY